MSARHGELPSLVSGDWLAANLDRVRVVDVRWYLDPTRSPAQAYAGGHIPGAVRLDMDSDLADPATVSEGRHPLASPQRFAAALGRAGIATGTPVVVYDDCAGAVVTRLWWMLHVIGEPVAVLDGGLAAWPGELSTEEPTFAAVPRAPVAWPRERFVIADEVAQSDRAVFDARAFERYLGDAGPSPDPRAGHIPGALSAPSSGNVGADGRFLKVTELRERFAAAAGAGAIAYCGSGITACSDLLAMTIAGYQDLALYVGSWSQWGADPSRPVETGPGTSARLARREDVPT
jgi:thiosulfate/3-mercaptopyruvate sulfurtransferase